MRTLNTIDYDGPLSIEWEDSGMDREYGAQDALAFVRKTDFSPSTLAFDHPTVEAIADFLGEVLEVATGSGIPNGAARSSVEPRFRPSLPCSATSSKRSIT